jgi:hypothetical protein
MTAPDPALTDAQFLAGLRALIIDSAHRDLPAPHVFEATVYEQPTGPDVLCVVARYRNGAGQPRRQVFSLDLVEVTEPEWDLELPPADL